LLFHPLAIASLLLLVFNDHYLKAAWPSALSGKLSDFAGVFLAPVVAFSAFELVLARFWTRPLSPRRTNAVAALLASVIAVGFALPEVWEPAERAYRYGLAALQLPFRAVISSVVSGAWPEFRPVMATADVTDLLALPMAFVAYRVMALREPTSRPSRTRLVAPATFVVVALLASARPCAAETTNHVTSKGGQLASSASTVTTASSRKQRSAAVSCSSIRQRASATVFARASPRAPRERARRC
jgi:hypothetical protein